MSKGIKFKSIISVALAAILVFGLAVTGFAAPPQTGSAAQEPAAPEQAEPITPETAETPQEAQTAAPEVQQPEPAAPEAAAAQEPVAGMAATTYTLTGTVYDGASGSAVNIPNASVQLEYLGGGAVPGANDTTDANGAYSLEVPDISLAYKLVVKANGYKIATADVPVGVSSPFGVAVTVQKLKGSVTFSPSFSGGTAAVKLYKGGVDTGQAVNLNSGGSFEFSKLDTASYTIKVVADGYKTVSSAAISVAPAQEDITVPAITVEGVKVTGSVKDDTAPIALPISGVQVKLTHRVTPSISYTATTDSSGNYSFDGVKKGIYNLEIDQQGYKEYTTTDPTKVDVNNTATEDTIVDVTVPLITLERVAIRVTANMVTPTGQPLATALDFLELYRTGSTQAYIQKSTLTSGSGQYFLTTDTQTKTPINDATTETYTIKAKLDKYITGIMSNVGIAKPRPTMANPLDRSTVLQPMTVSGKVFSGSAATGGKIPENTPVQLINASSGNEAMLTRTDVSGAFKFEYVPNGTYYAKIVVDGYIVYNGPQFTIKYEESAKDLGNITLDPTTIRGKITDKNQNPINGATVTLYKTRELVNPYPQPVEYPGLTNPQTVQSDGSYLFTTVPNTALGEDYTIIARKPATHWENSINGIKMDNSSTSTGHLMGHDIIMRPILDGFEVHGKVYNENNQLMPGAYVRIFDKNGDQVGKAVQTGSNGVYSFEKIQPDTGYVVKAANRGYALGKQPVTVIDKDVTVGDIKMTRQTPVYFKGVVVDTANANKGVMGLTVKIFAKNSDKELATATTDSAGKYTFTFSTPTTQLYIGAPYIIETQYKAISGKMYPTSRRDFDYMGWDEEDLNIKISPQEAIFRISGRASLNTMSGSPVPFDGAKVRLENYYFGTMGEAITGMDGTYNFYDLPAGLYNVYVSKEGYLKTEKKVETVQITDRDIMALDFVVTMQNAVSIGFDKELYYVSAGSAQQLGFAVQPPEAGLDNVVFVSSNPAIATVDHNGRVRGVSAGEAEITARVNDSTSISASCKVKVVKGATKVNISNETKNMFVGSRIQLKASVYPKDATLQGITWKSDNTARVTIDSGGYMRAISRGRALITATSEDGLAVAQCIVTVKQPVTQIKLTRSTNTVTSGKLVKIHSQVFPSNANDKTLSYTSKNTKVATVDKEGRVKGVGPGKTDIIVRATDGSSVYTRFTITVNTEVRSVALSQDNMRLVKGMRRTANAVVYTSGGKIKPKWSSNNPTVVQVDANGKLYAYNVGDAIITASATGITGTKSAKMRVTVEPSAIPMQSISISGAPNAMKVGSATWLSVNFNPINATDNKISWITSNRSVLDVNKDGKLNAKKAGTAVITATSGGVSRSVTITVKK